MKDQLRPTEHGYGWRKRCPDFAPPMRSTITHKPFEYMAFKVDPIPE